MSGDRVEDGLVGSGGSSSKRKKREEIDRSTKKNRLHPQKPKRIGRDNTSHGPVLEVNLIKIDRVIFGLYEIKPWFPSPYVLTDLEPNTNQNTTLSSSSSSSNTTITTQSHKPTRSSSSIASASSDHQIRSCKKSPSRKKKKTLDRHSTVILDGQSNLKKNINGSSYLNKDSLTQTTVSSISSHTQEFNTNDDNHQHRITTTSSLPSSPVESDPTIKLIEPCNQLLIDTIQQSSHEAHHDTNQKETKNSRKEDITNDIDPLVKLYVCNGCFKYMQSPELYLKHKKSCQIKHPPGRKVYERGKQIIWEVDGSESKLYCQCLCLFGKLFIDHKYIFFDVQGFKFYILTESNHQTKSRLVIVEEEVIGFFSKEKISYDGYNLACIVTFPPFQNKGIGTLLIEFSYELDRLESKNDSNKLLGTPERPLSELGAKTYLKYWSSVLLRYFEGKFKEISKQEEEEEEEGLIERKLDDDNDDGCLNELFIRNNSNEIELIKDPTIIKLMISLEQISKETKIRIDDVAFTLINIGLTKYKKKKIKPRFKSLKKGITIINKNQQQQQQEEEEEEEDSDIERVEEEEDGDIERVEEEEEEDNLVIFVCLDLVIEISKKLKIKPSGLDPQFILL